MISQSIKPLKFNEIINLSNIELSQKVKRKKIELSLLRFKKITGQKFKPSNLKILKNQIAQLKTAMTQMKL